MIERQPIYGTEKQSLDIDCSGQAGRWEKVIGTIADRRRCSKCKAELAWNIPYDKFCANCGAKMQKGGAE